jgi:hypothetical protein
LRTLETPASRIWRPRLDPAEATSATPAAAAAKVTAVESGIG